MPVMSCRRRATKGTKGSIILFTLSNKKKHLQGDTKKDGKKLPLRAVLSQDAWLTRSQPY